jgi:hypothetical protein
MCFTVTLMALPNTLVRNHSGVTPFLFSLHWFILFWGFFTEWMLLCLRVIIAGSFLALQWLLQNSKEADNCNRFKQWQCRDLEEEISFLVSSCTDGFCAADPLPSFKFWEELLSSDRILKSFDIKIRDCCPLYRIRDSYAMDIKWLSSLEETDRVLLSRKKNNNKT